MKRNIEKTVYGIVFFIILYLVLIYRIYYLLNTHSNSQIEIYTIVTSLFLLSRFVIAVFYDDLHKKRFKKEKYPTVSFVISCKNEEDSIGKTIDSCISSRYPTLIECIAINDGSTDNTLAEMKKAQQKYNDKIIKIISFQKNRGKREAMAEGVLKASGEVIIFVDSDSFVGKYSVKHLAEHFLSDEYVGAVSGNSMVENISTNALTKMQSARYGVSFDVFKACESVFGAVTCCPGCFSGYRKSAIMQVIDRWRYQKFLGTQSTFGDDRSLTNFVLRKWKVVYCRKAVATTIVPEKYYKFFKQQLRWKKSWIREGTNAGAFIWKKHPVAAISFYANLLIPILGPLVVLKIFVYDVLISGRSPFTFVIGVVSMSLLFGLYYVLIHPNKYWLYVTYFTVIYTFILIWQMPYALLKVRDTHWGTR